MSERTRALPPRPSLEQQKKQAKELLVAFRANDADAIARIREHLPDKERITLVDAQLALAREYGFASWAALKDHLDRAAKPVSRSVRRRVHDAFESRDDSTPFGWCCHGARYSRSLGDCPRVARLLLEAGAVPGPNLEDAPESCWQ